MIVTSNILVSMDTSHNYGMIWLIPGVNAQRKSLVNINPIKLLGYSHDIVVKSQIYAMKFASWHSKGIVKGFS